MHLRACAPADGGAPLRLPVLVCGESGTGRDAVVRALHDFGERPEAPLIPVRTGRSGPSAVPEGGADIYLDEVESLSPSEQSHWLRVLRNAEDAPDERTIRVVASTREDLEARTARRRRC